MVELMKSSPSAVLHRPKPSLKRVDSDPAQEERLKGFLLYFWGKGWGRDTGAGTVLLGSMTTCREGREHSQPSGLNYLLTQIIKFQGPHCSGATKTRGRPGPSSEQVEPSLSCSGRSSAGHKTLMLSKEAASLTGSWEVFNGSLKARPLKCLY